MSFAAAHLFQKMQNYIGFIDVLDALIGPTYDHQVNRKKNERSKNERHAAWERFPKTQNERHAAWERSAKMENERHAAWERFFRQHGPARPPQRSPLETFKTVLNKLFWTFFGAPLEQPTWRPKKWTSASGRQRAPIWRVQSIDFSNIF